MPGPVSSILNITCFRYVVQYPQLHISITFQSNCWCWQFCAVAAACHYDLITASISLNNVDIVTSLFPPIQTQTVTRKRRWQANTDANRSFKVNKTLPASRLTLREREENSRWKKPNMYHEEWAKFRLEGSLQSLIIVSGAPYFIPPLANTQNNETMMSSCQSLGF